MLNLFKKKEDDAPAAQVLGYQDQMVRIYSPQRLSMSQVVTLTLHLPSKDTVRAQVLPVTEESQQGKGAVYMGELQGPPELGEYIQSRMKAPPPPSPAPGGQERRRQSRVEHKIQVLSRQLPNFMAMSHDISESGMRLAVERPVEPGKAILITFDVDDTTSAPIQIEAETVWCQEKRQGIYWLGVRFVRVPAGQEKAVENLTRAVNQMRRKPGSKAFSLEP